MKLRKQGELTEMQFLVLAKLMRSREPVKTAAHLVLVGGEPIKRAVEATGMYQSSVSKTVGRYRAIHKLICEGYGEREGG